MSGHPSYRADIDGLRAVAVLAVVGYHAFPATVRAGFIGVDLFFVISGFLITTILLGSLERDRLSFADFYKRRVRRIFPALFLVLATTFAVGWFALLDDQYRQLGKHIAAGAGFVANLVSWREAGYFDAAADTKPLLHLWSLGIEEQFYLVWPLVVYTAWRLRMDTLKCTVAILLASFALNAWLARTDAVADFYSPLARFWELGLGAALAGLTTRDTIRTPSQSLRRSLLSLCGAALLIAGLATIRTTSAFPGWWALLPTLGATALIAAGPEAWINRHVLAQRPLVWVGLVSYPLYLWHWPILSFIRILAAERPTRSVRLAAIVAALLLAIATYRFVERPIRRGAGRRWLVPVFATAMLLSGLVGLACFDGDGFAFRDAARAPIVTVGDVGHDAFYRYPVGRFTPCEAAEVRAGAEAWDDIVRCWQSRPGPVDVVIIGDSHAEHLFVGLAEAMPGANVAYWLRSSAPVAANPAFAPVFRAALSQPRIKTVILAAWWSLRFGELPGGASPASALEATIAPLVAAGKTVWLADDVPNFSFDPRLCKYAGARLRSHKCTDPASFYRNQQAAYAGLFADLAHRDPRVHVLDLAKYFCTDGTCSMALDGRLLYRDSDHLNVAGSQWVGRNVLADHPELGHGVP